MLTSHYQTWGCFLNKLKISILATALVLISPLTHADSRFDEYKCTSSKYNLKIAVYSKQSDMRRHLEVIHTDTNKVARGLAQEAHNVPGVGSLVLTIPGYEWATLRVVKQEPATGIPVVLVRFRWDNKVANIRCKFYGW